MRHLPLTYAVSLLVAGLVLFVSVQASAQERSVSDTTAAPPTPSPSGIDTTDAVIDTLRVLKSPSGIDSVVTYSAGDSVVYSLATKTMYLYGRGNIKYKELGLKAENIDVNWNTSILNAVGVLDTADTTGKTFRGQPDLIDGGENYHGAKITYNFKSKKGKINLGETEIEKGLYYGEEIKRVDTDVLFVEEGKYTTCDLDHPHYYFGSPTMKVTVKDKVVARPVYLYVSDVPVFALPFGIFPSERGRRSGIIAPAYGENAERGRYLTHLGYYWAINDYLDANLRGDGYTKGTWVLYSDFRYALRYNFSGGISASYAKTISGLSEDPTYSKETQFNIHLGHNQEFNPTTRLVVDFTFSSGDYYQTTSNNMDELLRQNIVSNATLSKSWEGTPNSMTLNVRRDQVIGGPSAGELSEVLPSFGFNVSQSFPFRSKKSSTSPESMTWLELIGYTYGGQFINTRTKTKVDSTTFKSDDRRGVQHNVAINASPKLSYFTITPFFSYTEKWYDQQIERSIDPATNLPVTKDVNVIKAVRYYDLGVSAATKLYGVLQPGIFGIAGIRHQISPSLTYTYQPDFSDPRYGYYGSYQDTLGVEHKYSFYEREVYGGAPAGERQALGLNIGNVFEMKMEGTDSSGQAKKFTLLNLNAGLSYNFAADSLKFSEIGLDYRTSIGEAFSIGGHTSFNLYKFEVDPNNPSRAGRVNKFLLKEEGRLAQMTSYSISVSTRLSGEKKETKAGPVKSAEDSLAQKQKGGYVGLYEQAEPDFSIPWNLDLTWNFNQNQADPRVVVRSSAIAGTLGFNLTEAWKFTAGASYDLLNKQFAAPQVSVYRDLHCWEMSFNWVPTGQYKNFRLEIRLKAPQLRDVKLTKQDSARNVY